MKKRILVFVAVFLLAFSPLFIFAHSGRTDSSGGHHDYDNVSGLGSYHYHHGYGAHLHPGGVCPYSKSSSSSNYVSYSSKPDYEDKYNDLLDEYNELSDELEDEQDRNEALKENTIKLNEDINDLEKQRIWFGVGGGVAGLILARIIRAFTGE